MVWEDWAEILRANPGRAMLNRGRHNAQCLPVWKQSGPTLSAGCAHVGCAILGLSWSKSGPCWAIGPTLGLCSAKLGACWAMLGPCWAYVGPMLAYVGLCWAYVGPCWAFLEAMLGPCLGQLCWNDLKMPIFTPWAPSWSPKPCKNRGFSTSPRWNPLPPKGPKHRKKTMFFNTASKIHRKFQGLRGGSGLEAGRRQGRQRLKPSVTTEGLRQRHGLRPVGRRPDLKAYAWQTGAGRATTFGLWCGKIGPRFSAQTQGGLCWTEAGIMRSACLYGSWAQVVFWAAKTLDPPAWNTMATKDGEATKSHPKMPDVFSEILEN